MTQRIIHQEAVALEAVDIGLQEVDPVRVQEVEIGVENFARQVIIEPRALVVIIGEKSRGDIARVTLVHVGLEFQRIVDIDGREYAECEHG